MNPLYKQFAFIKDFDNQTMGMTKLEAFTLAAMQGFIAGTSPILVGGKLDVEKFDEDTFIKMLSLASVKLAKSTLDALAKEQGII